MSSTAIVLLVFAGGMHAGWNLLGKRSGSRVTAFLYAGFAGILLLLPFLIVFRSKIGAISQDVWFIFPLTGLSQAVYFVGLAMAYKSGALSLVYPIARSIPVLTVTLISLALGDSLGTVEITGAVLVFIGCTLRGLGGLKGAENTTLLIRALLLAFVAAIGTTGYTLLDYRGLSLMRATGEFGSFDAPLIYLFFQLVCTTIWLIAASLIFEKKLRDEKPRVGMSMGLVITLTYGLVLAAMAFTNVSSVASFRQLSIVFGAILGFVVLKERVTPLSIISITIIAAGMVLVAIA